MGTVQDAGHTRRKRWSGKDILLTVTDVLFMLWVFTEAVIPHTKIAQAVLALTMLAALAVTLERRKVFLSYWMVFAALLIVWNALGILFWSIDTQVAMQAVQTHLVNFVFFVLLFQYFIHRGDFERIITLYLFAFIAVVLYIFFKSGPSNILDERFGWLIYINANKVGILTTFALAFSLYKVLHKRYWALLPLAVTIIVEILALSFTALAGAAVVVVATILIAWPKHWPLKLLGLFAVGIGALVLLVQFWPLAKWKYDITMAALKTPPQMYGTSIEHRRWLIQFGLENFSKRPFTGYGSNCFYLLEGQARGNAGTYAHNNVIELLVDGGIVQLVLYYAVSVFALIRAFRHGESGLTMRKMLGILYIAMLFMEIGTVACFSRSYLVIPILLIAASFSQEPDGKWLQRDFLRVRRATPETTEKTKVV
ncbi:MAG TPA: O-antigen ligase family protein [Eubacteriales bacterium]|nr:O-antigen ligase family protein [Eubacteriales bacterium]